MLPTTNEITVLRYGPAGSNPAGTARSGKDAYFERTLPAPLLSEINIVDTPGTNVILRRQQQLTEEFVPRADLVLFVLSSDRPFSDSEVRFLQYIKQWGKKIVFVVNKSDILADDAEKEEVVRFVADNSARLLGSAARAVLPVSARLALEAKKEAVRQKGSWRKGSEKHASQEVADPALLARDPRWRASGFDRFEDFIFTFLRGGAPGESGGSEALRLKLGTPLMLGEALLSAAVRVIESETEAAEAEITAVGAVRAQIADVQGKLAQDHTLQRGRVAAVIGGATERGDRFLDNTLRLTNASALISAYILGQPSSMDGQSGSLPPVQASYSGEVIRGADQQLRTLLLEHRSWLTSNVDRQKEYYTAYAAKRHAEVLKRATKHTPRKESFPPPVRGAGGAGEVSIMTPPPPPSDAGDDVPKVWRDGKWQPAADLADAMSRTETAALEVAANFDAAAAARLLEEEVRAGGASLRLVDECRIKGGITCSVPSPSPATPVFPRFARLSSEPRSGPPAPLPPAGSSRGSSPPRRRTCRPSASPCWGSTSASSTSPLRGPPRRPRRGGSGVLTLGPTLHSSAQGCGAWPHSELRGFTSSLHSLVMPPPLPHPRFAGPQRGHQAPGRH